MASKGTAALEAMIEEADVSSDDQRLSRRGSFDEETPPPSRSRS
ncbi:hypothetical protein [Micromonospora aurantiaca (nom. illeg.)]